MGGGGRNNQAVGSWVEKMNGVMGTQRTAHTDIGRY